RFAEPPVTAGGAAAIAIGTGLQVPSAGGIVALAYDMLRRREVAIPALSLLPEGLGTRIVPAAPGAVGHRRTVVLQLAFSGRGCVGGVILLVGHGEVLRTCGGSPDASQPGVSAAARIAERASPVAAHLQCADADWHPRH